MTALPKPQAGGQAGDVPVGCTPGCPVSWGVARGRPGPGCQLAPRPLPSSWHVAIPVVLVRDRTGCCSRVRAGPQSRVR